MRLPSASSEAALGWPRQRSAQSLHYELANSRNERNPVQGGDDSRFGSARNP